MVPVGVTSTRRDSKTVSIHRALGLASLTCVFLQLSFRVDHYRWALTIDILNWLEKVIGIAIVLVHCIFAIAD